jgi:hypothetical protein
MSASASIFAIEKAKKDLATLAEINRTMAELERGSSRLLCFFFFSLLVACVGILLASYKFGVSGSPEIIIWHGLTPHFHGLVLMNALYTCF